MMETNVRFWVKLKVLNEWNSDETAPGLPDCEVETMYGLKDCPSNSADDAFPNEESESVPEIISTRSG